MNKDQPKDAEPKRTIFYIEGVGTDDEGMNVVDAFSDYEPPQAPKKVKRGRCGEAPLMAIVVAGEGCQRKAGHTGAHSIRTSGSVFQWDDNGWSLNPIESVKPWAKPRRMDGRRSK